MGGKSDALKTQESHVRDLTLQLAAEQGQRAADLRLFQVQLQMVEQAAQRLLADIGAMRTAITEEIDRGRTPAPAEARQS